MLAFYLDFGWLGPIVMGLLWGLIVKKIYTNYRNKSTASSFAYYLFVLNGIFSSIQNYAFIGVSTMMILILISFLLKDREEKG